MRPYEIIGDGSLGDHMVAPTESMVGLGSVVCYTTRHLQMNFYSKHTMSLTQKIGIVLGCCWFLLVACGGGDESKSIPENQLDPTSLEGMGEKVFISNCAACHAVKGDRVVVGPSLEGIATRAATRVEGQSAEDYLYSSILNPNDYIVEGFSEGSMQQNFASVLTSEEVTQVIAYLGTLH